MLAIFWINTGSFLVVRLKVLEHDFGFCGPNDVGKGCQFCFTYLFNRFEGI